MSTDNKVLRTQGVWLTSLNDSGRIHVNIDGDMVTVAQCYAPETMYEKRKYTFDNGENKTNAEYICKAVNNFDYMLQTLKNVLLADERNNHILPPAILIQVNEAISKAEQ